MSKRNIMRIFSIALMVAMIAMCLSNIAFADMPDPSDFKGSESTTKNSFNNILDTVLGVVQVIGVAIAVIMLIVLAIKYISSAPGERAEIKKHAVVYIVGAVVLFGATGLLQIIKTFASETIKSTTPVGQ